VGWTIAPPDITLAIRKVHDFLTVGAAAPLQAAGAVALHLPQSYYDKIAALYQARRDEMLQVLREAGFVAWTPRGAYYIMTDASAFGFPNDVAFAQHLVEKVGVAAVPGSSFYKDDLGSQQLRFAFCKRPETLRAAEERLRRLSPR